MLRHEIRIEIFEHLKKCSSTQTSSIIHHLEQKYGRQYAKENGRIICEIISELITNNILMPGTGNINNTHQYLPFITLTSYGKEVIEHEMCLPYDTDNYLTEVKGLVADIDKTLLIYLGECKTTYNKNLLLSATITLGVASEQLILILINAFVHSTKDASKKKKILKELADKFVFKKYKIFRQYFDPLKKSLPKQLTGKLDTYLDAIFNFIRENRNEAGHPTGISMTKKELFAYLQIFSDYAKKIYDLIDYLKTNKI